MRSKGLPFSGIQNIAQTLDSIPWTKHRPLQGLYLHRTTQTQKNVDMLPCSSGMPTHDRRVRVAEHSTRHRSCSHCEWHGIITTNQEWIMALKAWDLRCPRRWTFTGLSCPLGYDTALPTVLNKHTASVFTVDEWTRKSQ
jgi:hypothetical protein